MSIQVWVDLSFWIAVEFLLTMLEYPDMSCVWYFELDSCPIWFVGFGGIWNLVPFQSHVWFEGLPGFENICVVIIINKKVI